MSIKIGVIGAGMIGSDHALRIKNSLKGGIINSISDINKENSKMLSNELGGVKIFEDPYALIKSSEVDAILVCSIGPTH